MTALDRLHPAQPIEALSVPQSVAYNWEYDATRKRLMRLYENAKRDQWNATERLDWTIDVDPESEIIVSAGATGAMYCAFLALLNPGDEVIVFEPYYGYHVSTLVASGAVPVYIPLAPPDWTFRREDLESAVTGRTKAVLVNTPANPSGKVFSREELLVLADFAHAHDLFVFTDEIYEHFLYDGWRHTAPARHDLGDAGAVAHIVVRILERG